MHYEQRYADFLARADESPWSNGGTIDNQSVFGGNAMNLISNSLRSSAANGSDATARINSLSNPSPSQWGSFRIKAITSEPGVAKFGGLFLRMTTGISTVEGYKFVMSINDALNRSSLIAKVVTGVGQTILLTESATTWTANDVLRGEITVGGRAGGNTAVLSLYRNDTLLLRTEDADLPDAGSGGVFLSIDAGGSGVGALTLDQFQVGDLWAAKFNLSRP